MYEFGQHVLNLEVVRGCVDEDDGGGAETTLDFKQNLPERGEGVGNGLTRSSLWLFMSLVFVVVVAVGV